MGQVQDDEENEAFPEGTTILLITDPRSDSTYLGIMIRFNNNQKIGVFMADEPVIHIGENSPEQVAFKLFQLVAKSEGFSLTSRESHPTKGYILTTYAQCLHTVRRPDNVGYALTLTS
jgi:hypothetical protein